MKTIPLEQLGERVSKAIEGQQPHEVIRLTKDAGTVALLLRLPDTMKDIQSHFVFVGQEPSGQVVFIPDASQARQKQEESVARQPVFGAGRGTLTIVSDDEEHLDHYKEYME